MLRLGLREEGSIWIILQTSMLGQLKWDFLTSPSLRHDSDPDARSKALATYLDEIEKIRKESKLPESMKSENPKPVIAIGSAQESGKRKITGSANE